MNDYCADATLNKNGTTVSEQPFTLQTESNVVLYFMFEFGFSSPRQEGLFAFGLDGSGAGDQEWGVAAPGSTNAGPYGSRQSGTVMWSFDHVAAGDHAVQVFARVSTGAANLNGCALTVFVVPTDGPNGESASVPIGTGYVTVTQDELSSTQELSAFVATGSLSTGCQATFSESDFAEAGETLFCAPRQFDGKDGILLHVFLPSPPPPEFVFAFNVYQPFAKGYADPVLYTG